MGRFLSPDPFVPDPLFSQDYNRYTYCRNNPLKYVDPDGEFIWFVVGGAILGSFIGGSMAAGTMNVTQWGGTNWWQGTIAGAFVGVAAGGMLASAVGAAGMVSGNAATTAWGTTSAIVNSASINIGINAISGGGWDGAWRAGLVGAATGA